MAAIRWPVNLSVYTSKYVITGRSSQLYLVVIIIVITISVVVVVTNGNKHVIIDNSKYRRRFSNGLITVVEAATEKDANSKLHKRWNMMRR